MATATAAMQQPTAPEAPAAARAAGAGLAHVTDLRGLVGALRNLSGFGCSSRLDRLFSPRVVAQRFEVVAADGDRITVETSGAGRPMLLVHGLGGSHQDWDDVVEPLARTHRVCTFDLRGHGARAAADARPTLGQMAEDVALVIEQLSLERPLLVGHSMGALVVMRYLQEHGCDGLGGVCLIDQSPRLTTDADWKLGLFGTLSLPQVRSVMARLRRDFVGTALAMAGVRHGMLRRSGALGRALRWLLARLQHAIGVAPVLSMLESMVETDFRGVIGALPLPALVVLGGSSHHYGGLPLADYYRNALKRGIITTYAGSAHSPHRQEPARFAADLAAFASRHCTQSADGLEPAS